jgi:hypothetical protein
MSACLPTRSHQHALAPFPKNFWLHALRETGSDQADGKAWQVSFTEAVVVKLPKVFVSDKVAEREVN